MPSRPVAALFALLLVAAVGGQAAAVTADAAIRSPGQADAGQLEAATSPPNTTMEIRVRSDGDARWRVVAAVPIRDNDTASFDRLAARFEEGEGPDLGLGAFQRASEAASEETGRNMVVRDVDRSSAIRNGTGRLVLAFTWTNFAREENDRLHVRDAFQTPDGTWLPGLAANQTLVMYPPEDYGVFGAPIGPDNGTLRWEGETNFESDGPWAIYEGSETPTPSDPWPGDVPIWGVVLVGGVFGVAVIAYALRDSDVTVPDLPADGSTPDDGPDAAARDPERESATEAEPVGAADASEDAVDEELLSDEERVERLIERNGGRMKQATIVKETGWSNAKVSQLLSSMADEGRIEKLRLGRENLISFPDEDVTDFER